MNVSLERITLFVSLLTFLSFGTWLFVAIALEGQGTPLIWSFVGMEFTAALLILWVLKRSPTEG